MLADTIKEIRKKHYLNQAAFAKLIGVTQSAVSQWENDLTRPNSYQLEAIAKLEEASILSNLPDIMQYTAKLRADNPELSISELAALHNPPITKSCLNHRLRKLTEMASKL